MDDFNLLVFAILIFLLIISKQYQFKEKWMNLARLITIMIGSFFLVVMAYISFGLTEGWFAILMWMICGVSEVIKIVEFLKE